VDFEEMAAELPGNAVVAGLHITQIGFLPERRSTPDWRRFHRHFLPHCSPKIQKTIFDHFHNVAHLGRLTSHRSVSSRYVWCLLSSDVTTWACGCLACQLVKIHRHARLAPQPIPIPQRRISHLNVDLVGPLQYSNNFNYIFTIIDRTSKWMEAIPLSEMSVVACAKALTFTWISRFGVPETITSDLGPQFTSSLWFQFWEMLNISHKKTTAYHPESNGAVKRRHRRLKDALRAHAAAATWSKELPFVLLGLRGKTLVFPRLRQFSVPQLCCQMNFCKMLSFQLFYYQNFFLNLACSCFFFA
jgi:hypothetical protein